MAMLSELSIELGQEAEEPLVQVDWNLIDLKFQRFRPTNIENVLNHTPHVLGCILKSKQSMLRGWGTIHLITQKVQTKLNGRQRVFQVVHNEMEKVLPLLLKVNELITFSLDFSLKTLQPHKTSDSGDKFGRPYRLS
jgi:hypothetical protein